MKKGVYISACSSRRAGPGLCLGAVLVLLAVGACTNPGGGGYSPPPIPTNLTITVDKIDGLSSDFMKGVDISMLAQIEASGGVYYDENLAPRDALEILRDHGVNWVRLRLWHNPVFPAGTTDYHGTPVTPGPAGGGNCDASVVRGLAKRAKDLGLKVYLAFHYSDFWADPGKQDTPAAWAGMNIDQLEDALHDYTLQVLTDLTADGATPDMVGIGNEINGGMCWNDDVGRVIDKNSPDSYLNLIRLLNAGAQAVRSAAPGARIMIHIAEGGNLAEVTRFFNNVDASVDYDVIGLSFYPYWHGTLSQLAATLNTCAASYNKPVVVAESAYAYTDANGDAQGNSWWGNDPTAGGFEVSVQGQATALREVAAAVAQVPAGRGLGVFYWEPDWIPVSGAGWITGQGDGWDNQTWWDFNGHPLESMWTYRLIAESSTTSSSIITSIPAMAVATTVGTAPVLPAAVSALYSDGAYRQVSVTWDAVDPAQYAAEGAFSVNGAVAGTSIAATANVTVVKVNFAVNGGFESGSMTPWTSSALSGGSSVSVFGVEASSPSGNTHAGSYTGTYWYGSAYTFDAHQTIAGLAPGTYVFTAWVMGDGSPVSLNIYADNGTVKATAAVTNTGWQQWHQYTISGITVGASGELVIGFEGDMSAGDWGKLDDAAVNLE